MSSMVQYIFYLAFLVALAIPVGSYISKAMEGKPVFLSRILRPCENGIFKLLHINENENMGWKKYLFCALAFNLAGLIFLFAILMLQGVLPWNPQGMEGLSWHLAFNTASSFVTNTNWQTYSGEFALSNLSQSLGLTVQNFVSAACGIAVLFALIRGLMKVREKGIGNFWADLVRATLYVMMPLCIVVTIALIALGVPQSLGGGKTVDILEPIAVVQTADGYEVLSDAEIDPETDAVMVDGEVVPEAKIVTQQYLPLYPQASQVAPKQAGTNGGGIVGTNSAHPFENPNALTNLFEMTLLLLIPVALCFSFGKCVKDKRQGIAIFLAMFIMLVVALGVVASCEQAGTPQLAQDGAVQMIGNMEGKETRFGIATSSTWAAFTTAASNGSVNSMHDSYTPIGGMIPMLLMMLGEIVFGGVGCGLYGMIGFVLLAVFIAGLMVGRTPEYLGKKIESREMRMAILLCLATPIALLVGSGIATLLPSTADALNNSGAHGLSEVLYNYASAAGNNGSAFAGMGCDTPFLNTSIGLVMLFVRFVPMTAAIVIAGSMAAKKKVAASAGTLSTSNAMFVFLLILVVLIIGALSYLPALALGPIAEFTQMIGIG